MRYLGQTPELQSDTYKKEEVDGLLAAGLAKKQNTLVSGTNIKTVGGNQLLGSGDVQVQAPLVSGTNIKTVGGNQLLGSGDVQVQAPLVSGTNIKTLNGASLLGSGDFVLASTPTVLQRTITGAAALIATDQGKLINASGTFTLAVTAAATLGDGWYCWLRNTSNGDVTVDPNTSEQIDGATTFVLKPGFTVLLTCTGTAFGVMTLKRRTYDNISSFTANGTFVVPADTYVIRGYAWGKGGDGTAAASGAGGGCAYGDIAVTPGETVSVTISSGVATVTTAGTARLTANAASGVTAGTASKHASVTNGGAYSGGAGEPGVAGGGASSGSPLGNGLPGGWGNTGGSSWGFTAAGLGGAGIGQAAAGPWTLRYLGGSSLRDASNAYTDPLLLPLTGVGGYGGMSSDNPLGGVAGGAGGGGGAYADAKAGKGGFGAGGGSGSPGGDGGFGGGGGSSGSGLGGNGGLGGGGGGKGSVSGSTGGAACVLIYY